MGFNDLSRMNTNRFPNDQFANQLDGENED